MKRKIKILRLHQPANIAHTVTSTLSVDKHKVEIYLVDNSYFEVFGNGIHRGFSMNNVYDWDFDEGMIELVKTDKSAKEINETLASVLDAKIDKIDPMAEDMFTFKDSPQPKKRGRPAVDKTT